MLEPKGTIVEVWGVAADEVGISLLSDGDAWRSRDVIRHGHRSWDEAKWLVRDVPRLLALHQTSTRDGHREATPDGYRQHDVFVHTYVAVVGLADLAEADWPAAQPVTLPLLRHVGKQARVGPIDEPQPTYLHVLEHALRHIAWLVENDGDIRDALGEVWRRHLRGVEPELATMFIDPHERAA